jgi:hypothetical protein
MYDPDIRVICEGHPMEEWSTILAAYAVEHRQSMTPEQNACFDRQCRELWNQLKTKASSLK